MGKSLEREFSYSVLTVSKISLDLRFVRMGY